ncbi:MAG TPA: c-type cytochrome [Terriglobales bacterium]|nr:c-type cytochrome [Terriglobales bacterium]
MKTRTVAIFFLMFTFAGVAAAQDAAAGKTIFTSKCALCHGADGKAQTPMGKTLKIADFHSPDVQNKSDAELKGIITNGKNKMPAFKGKLTDAQAGDVVAYIRELGK